MLMIPRSVKIFIATQPADMRRSFDGLAAMTRATIREDPLSGHLFVFVNRRGDRIKVLWWDRGGYCLWYKRLEKGVFRIPQSKSPSIEIDMATLTLILEGIELRGAKRREHYVPRACRTFCSSRYSCPFVERAQKRAALPQENSTTFQFFHCIGVEVCYKQVIQVMDDLFLPAAYLESSINDNSRN